MSKQFYIKQYNKDEVNSLNILSNGNYEASSQKFTQVISTQYSSDIINHEEGWRTYRPKRREYYNTDEVNSPNILRSLITEI